jgi:hypothetical protein
MMELKNVANIKFCIMSRTFLQTYCLNKEAHRGSALRSLQCTDALSISRMAINDTGRRGQ